MSEPRWLEGHSGQTTDELIALEGQYRTDSIVLAFEEAIRHKASREGAGRLTEAEVVVLAVEALEREVNSDGFGGLFLNASEHVPQLVAALTSIGEGAVADLARTAIAALGIDGPLTPESVVAAMEPDDEDRDERLAACDEAYYEAAGDLAGPLLEYIKANRTTIVIR